METVLLESWRDVRYVLEDVGLQNFMWGVVKEEEHANDDSQILGINN